MAETENARDPGSAGTLDREAILGLLPHRPPILLVDRLADLVPGRQAIGYKELKEDDPIFTGHFPAEPIMPGVLIVEACAQVGALALTAAHPDPETVDLAVAGRPTGYLASINRFKFLEVVRPGDCLEMVVTVGRRLDHLVNLACEVRVGRRRVAKGDVAVALRR